MAQAEISENDSSVLDRSGAVCIVGAGPAGLAMARALKARNIEYDHYERNDGVGGLWDIDAPGSPMYDVAHFISSKTVSGFREYPMPDSFPDYPSHRMVLGYLRGFAAHYGLDKDIYLGVGIDKLDKNPDGTWTVERSDGVRLTYRAVIACTGAQWEANLPPGPDGYTGETIHSSEYRNAAGLSGKSVIVVGGGNSACDIAVDVSRVAEHTTISMRRGYWFIPKHIFGVPSDLITEHGPPLPKWFEQRVFGAMLKFLYGKPQRLGLQKPDHKLFETHPVLNTNLYSSLQHGDLDARPGIVGAKGTTVRFADGTSTDADLIIYATGYRHSARYAQQYFGSDQHPSLYLTCFSRDHHNLFGGSFTETNTGAYVQFDITGMMIASYLDDQTRRPEAAHRFDELIAHDNPDLSGGLKFDTSARHAGYVDGHAFIHYRNRLAKRMGWAFKDAPVAKVQVITSAGSGAA